MPHGWWRRAIERRLETLSALALIAWVAVVAGASAMATSRVTAALSSERQQIAQGIAARVERAIDAELSRLYHEPGAATAPLHVQLPRTLPAMSTLLQDYAREPFRVELVDLDARELAASRVSRERLRDDQLVLSTARVGRTDWFIRVAQARSEALEPVFWLRRLLVWSSVLACGFAVLLAWGAARSVRQPIQQLTLDAQRLARGELREPIAPAGVDEIGRLAEALERMRRALVQDELLGRLLKKVIAAQEEERKRLARELHDETSQQLTALGIQIDMIARAVPSAPPAAAARLAEAKTLVGRMIDDLHRVIYDLRPSMLDDLGLLPAIKWYAERRLVSRGLTVQFEFPEGPLDLPAESRIAVYRVVQEALSNVERHAQAETVLVACDVADDTLTIEIEDDGVGFRPEDMTHPRESGQGLGLLGMRERLSLIGGSCTIESSPGQGTRLIVRVPLPSGATAAPPAPAVKASVT